MSTEDRPELAVIAGLDTLTAAPDPAEPPARYNRMANSTWRLLEERRMDAVEAIAEIDEAIRVLQERREDALRSQTMCDLAQKVLTQ